jgi:hypothetical protein
MTELKRFPVEGEPRLDMAAGLSGFTGTIEPHTNATDMAAPIDLVFNVNDLSAESLIENFVSPEGQPINGSLVVPSSKIAGGAVTVPVILDPRNPGTYGGNVVEGDVWVNRTPFPAKRVSRVHALMVQTERAEILTWDLDHVGGIAPGQGLVLATGADFPEKILREASRIWVEYEVDRSCRSCAEQVIGVGAVTSEARSVVEFVMPASFVDELDVEEIEIAFKSRYLRPEGDRERMAAPIVLTRDAPSSTSPMLYLPDDGQLGFGSDLFSYRARLFALDARELCTAWIADGSPRIRLRRADFSEGACE